MRNLIFVLLSITLLTSCTNTNVDKGDLKDKVRSFLNPNSDRSRDGFKGKVVATYYIDPLDWIIFTEYDKSGRKIRKVEFIQHRPGDGSVREKIYNYSKNKLESIDVIHTHNFHTEISKEYSEEVKKESKTAYIYKYDEIGNWIERSHPVSHPGNVPQIDKRTIFYEGEDYQDIVSTFESIKSILVAQDDGSYSPDELTENVQQGNKVRQSSESQQTADYSNENQKTTIKKIILDDRRYYYGEVVNDVENGKGKLFVDGIIGYDGQWVDGVPNGQGKFYYDDGTLMYEGGFKDYVMDGRGRKYSQAGDLDYAGEWKSGAPHGKGTVYNDDGTILYEGEWRNGTMEGIGRFTMSTGELVEAEWKNNKLIPGTERIVSTSSSQSGISNDDVVRCKNCGKSLHMKDGYVRTLSNPRAYLGWSHIQKIEVAKNAGYPQETINALTTNVKYGDWYCSKKCAWESGVETVDE